MSQFSQYAVSVIIHSFLPPPAAKDVDMAKSLDRSKPKVASRTNQVEEGEVCYSQLPFKILHLTESSRKGLFE